MKKTSLWIAASSIAFASCGGDDGAYRLRFAREGTRARAILEAASHPSPHATGPFRGGRCVTTLDGKESCWSTSSLADATLHGSVACAPGEYQMETCCTEDAEQKLACWNCNTHVRMAMRPTQVRGLGNVEEIAIGFDFACARTRDGDVRCWGDTRRDSQCTLVPALVPTMTGAEGIAAGEGWACAVRRGEVWCWGQSSVFPRRDDVKTADARTLHYEPIRAPTRTPVRAISMHSLKLCMLDSRGEVTCIGDMLHEIGVGADLGSQGDKAWTERPPFEGVTGATAIAVGGGSLCALLPPGGARCIGRYNMYGVLGDGTLETRIGFRDVVGVRDVVALASGQLRHCALVRDGSARCWGFSTDGSVGDGDEKKHYVPRPVDPGVRDVVELALGSAHTCAVLKDTGVVCWGANQSGQLGTGDTKTRTAPVRVEGLDKVKHLFAGHSNTCVVREDGTAWCWGLNTFGQVGSGPRQTSDGEEKPALQVPEPEPALKMPAPEPEPNAPK